MFRKLLFGVALVGVTGIAMADRCADEMIGKTYSCRLSIDAGFNTLFNISFSAPTDPSVYGDMEGALPPSWVLSCSCATKGKPFDPEKGKAAKLKSTEKSNEFFCELLGGTGVYFGKVVNNGAGIKKGRFFTNRVETTGDGTGVFECEQTDPG